MSPSRHIYVSSFIMLFASVFGCDVQEQTRLVEHDIVWIGVPWVQDEDGQWLLVDTGSPRSIVVPNTPLEPEHDDAFVETRLQDWSPLGHVSTVPVLLSNASIGEIAAHPEPYGGVLGLDILEEHPLLIDARDNRLYVGDLEGVELESTASRMRIPIERLGPGTLCPESGFCVPYGPNRIVFEVSIGDVDTWAILDTGAAVSLVTEGMIRRISAQKDVPSLRSTSEADALAVDLHRVDIAFGEHEVHNTIVGTGFEEALFAKLQVETGRRIEVVLGWSSLDDFAVELDAQAPSLHLHPYSDAAEPRVVYGTGMLLRTDEDGCYRVITLDEEQPASIAGVQLGDCVTSVNGEDLSMRSAQDVNREMSQLGASFDVVIARAQQQLAVTLEVVELLPMLPS